MRNMHRQYKLAFKVIFNIARLPFLKLNTLSNLITAIRVSPQPKFFSEAENSKAKFNPNLLPVGEKNARRSIIFTHHCYYNFFYLAKALRKRGWDALCINLESKESPFNQFYHGEDANLYDPDPSQYYANLFSLHEIIKSRFKMIHFYGAGNISHFASSKSKLLSSIPWDYLDLKKAGVKIGYTYSGCLDMVKQSTFNKWTNGKCSFCAWKKKPDVCSDSLNAEWGYKVSRTCDLLCIETDVPLDYRNSRKTFLEPLTMVLDPELWHPDISIPKKFKIDKVENEILIYHGVGNYKERSIAGVNFKGSEIIFATIETLKEKGYPIRLLFFDKIASIDMRYLQLQSDIVIDQLRYGRYGANARECLMLGKPVIANIDFFESKKLPLSQCIRETPIIHSDGSNLESILIDLIENPEKRKVIGARSREHAMKWWSIDACAERFERVYDALMMGKSPGNVPAIIES